MWNIGTKMPTYEYKCSGCEHAFELVQSMKDKPKKKCPSCGKNKLKKVLFPPTVFTKSEPKTIGHWADRNTQKMGHYELGDKDGERKENLKKDKSTLGDGPATPKQIRKMTPQQKQNYIEKGEK